MTRSVSPRLRNRCGLTLVQTSTSRRTGVSASGQSGAEWGIAEEVPVEIGFNGKAWTVMMATPADLEDLAVGLALTEGAIRSAEDIERVAVKSWPEGMTADVTASPDALQTDRIRRRALDGRTGCGLCGVERLAELHRPTLPARPGIDVTDSAIAAAFEALPVAQALNAQTRSVHAAAWCDLDGRILDIREDVGRHNALDKLVGARLRRGETTPGFVVLSSRCSFELVFKAARLGAACLATVSAPTGLALDLAAALELPLASRDRQGAAVRFDQGEMS